MTQKQNTENAIDHEILVHARDMVHQIDQNGLVPDLVGVSVPGIKRRKDWFLNGCIRLHLIDQGRIGGTHLRRQDRQIQVQGHTLQKSRKEKRRKRIKNGNFTMKTEAEK